MMNFRDILVKALVFFGALTATSAQYPSPSGCTQLVVGMVDDVVNAAYDIAQATTDCTLPGLSENSCAADLTDMLSYWFNLANKISTATLECGRLDNLCSADITQGLGDLSDTSNVLIAASSDCMTSAFLCVYDVITAVDDMNGFISDILGALDDCNAGSSVPGPLALNTFFGNQDGGSSGRRLSEADTVKAQEIQDEVRVSLDQMLEKLRQKRGANSTAVVAAQARESRPKEAQELAVQTSEARAKLTELVEQLKKHLKELQDSGLAPSSRNGAGIVVV